MHLRFLLVIVTVVVIVTGILLVIFFVTFFFLLCILNLFEFFPLLREYIRFRHVVCDDYVIEDCATFHSPKVKTKKSKICKFVQTVIVYVLGIVNFFRLPKPLVGG